MITKAQGVDGNSQTTAFNTGFESSYSIYRRLLEQYGKIGSKSYARRGNFGEQVERAFGLVTGHLEDYVEGRGTSEIGSSMGILMASLHYGVFSDFFLAYETTTDYPPYVAAIKGELRKFMGQLWKINKGLQCIHIAEEVQSLSGLRHKNQHYSIYSHMANDLVSILTESPKRRFE